MFLCMLLTFLSLVIYLGSSFNSLFENIRTGNRAILPCPNAEAFCFVSQGEGMQLLFPILFLGHGKECKPSRLQSTQRTHTYTPHPPTEPVPSSCNRLQQLTANTPARSHSLRFCCALFALEQKAAIKLVSISSFLVAAPLTRYTYRSPSHLDPSTAPGISEIN